MDQPSIDAQDHSQRATDAETASPADHLYVLSAKRLAKEIIAEVMSRPSAMIDYCDVLKAVRKLSPDMISAGHEVAKHAGISVGTIRDAFKDTFIPNPKLYDGELDKDGQVPFHHNLNNLLVNTISGLMKKVATPLKNQLLELDRLERKLENLLILTESEMLDPHTYLGDVYEMQDDPVMHAIAMTQQKIKHKSLDIALTVEEIMPAADILPDRKDYADRAKTIISLADSRGHPVLDKRYWCYSI